MMYIIRDEMTCNYLTRDEGFLGRETDLDHPTHGEVWSDLLHPRCIVVGRTQHPVQFRRFTIFAPPKKITDSFSKLDLKGFLKNHRNMWVFPKIGVPQNGWYIMENPIKHGWFGGSTIFRKPPCISCFDFTPQPSTNLPTSLGLEDEPLVTFSHFLPRIVTCQLFHPKKKKKKTMQGSHVCRKW